VEHLPISATDQERSDVSTATIRTPVNASQDLPEARVKLVSLFGCMTQPY